MELSFNAKPYKGKVSKYATIQSNDTTQAAVRIYLDANVYITPDTVNQLTWLPAQLELDKDGVRKDVVVANMTEGPIDLKVAGGMMDKMKVRIKDKGIKPQKTGRIEFAWTGDIPKQDIKHSVTFDTGNPMISRITVPYVIKGTEPVAESMPVARPTAPAASKARPQPTVQPPGPAQWPPSATPQVQPVARPDTSAKVQPKPVPEENPKTSP